MVLNRDQVRACSANSVARSRSRVHSRLRGGISGLEEAIGHGW